MQILLQLKFNLIYAFYLELSEKIQIFHVLTFKNDINVSLASFKRKKNLIKTEKKTHTQK